MAGEGKVSSRGAKDILVIMHTEGGKPKIIAEQKGLMQKSDVNTLEIVVKEIISANAKVVAEYKAGKEVSLQFLIGQGMKATKGSANPQLLGEIFKRLLD